LLWYDEPAEGRYYSHLGGAYYYNSPPRDTVRFRSIPEIFVGEQGAGAVGTSGQAIPGALNGTPFFVDTLPLLADSVNTFGVENLTVHGALSFQSEAMAAIVGAVSARYRHGNVIVQLFSATAKTGLDETRDVVMRWLGPAGA
jgi:phosphate-selective porin OprO/OprP